jgi:hypothetical protein
MVAVERNEVMVLVPTLRPVGLCFPNKLGPARRPHTGKLLEEDVRTAEALRVPRVAMEKAVTAMGPRRIAIAQAIMMVATEKKESGLLRKWKKVGRLLSTGGGRKLPEIASPRLVASVTWWIQHHHHLV